MKRQVNLSDARARLSELVDAALAGDEVVIARRNVPSVRLVAIAQAKGTPRFGLLAGQIHMADDFDAPIDGFAAPDE